MPLARSGRPLDCPFCELVNPPGTEQCDCGFHFAATATAGTQLSEVAFRNLFVGALIILGGVVAAALLKIVLALSAFISGAGLFLLGLRQASRARRLSPKGNPRGKQLRG